MVHSIRINSLGGLRVEVDGAAVPDLSGQPVRSALFVYLALEPSATRDELRALLWPDSDAERARYALSQTLYELGRQLRSGCIEAQGERLQIPSEVAVDAVGFQQAVQSGHDEGALSLYGGSLLKGWQPPVTPEFESGSTGGEATSSASTETSAAGSPRPGYRLATGTALFAWPVAGSKPTPTMTRASTD